MNKKEKRMAAIQLYSREELLLVHVVLQAKRDGLDIDGIRLFDYVRLAADLAYRLGEVDVGWFIARQPRRWFELLSGIIGQNI